ncbi:hypothetical protein Tco_1255378 [Tanacetum coccineum]
MYIMTPCPQTRIPSRPHLGCDRLVFRAKVIENQVHVVPADLPVAPKVGAALVASTAGVLELDIHSSSESGPSEGSLPPVPVAPMMEEQSCITTIFTIGIIITYYFYFRDPYCSHSTTPPTIVAPSTDIISPIVAPPEVRRRRAVLIRPGQDIPVGSSLDYSSSDRSPADHSSSGHSTLDHTLYGHTSLAAAKIQYEVAEELRWLANGRPPRGRRRRSEWQVRGSDMAGDSSMRGCHLDNMTSSIMSCQLREEFMDPRLHMIPFSLVLIFHWLWNDDSAK